MTSFLILAALSFKPLMPEEMLKSENANEGCCSKLIKVENWRNRKYVIWALVVPLALFGYFVPYVHIVRLEARKEFLR